MYSMYVNYDLLWVNQPFKNVKLQQEFKTLAGMPQAVAESF